MKKTIAIILIILISLNLLGTKVYGVDYGTHEDLDLLSEAITESNFDSLMDYGETTTSGENKESNRTRINNSTTLGITITKILATLVVSIGKVINFISSAIVNGSGDSTGSNTVTVQKILNNEYGIFGIDFYNSPNAKDSHAQTISKFRNNVAVWYISLRNIALIGMVIILIYIGIRLALLIGYSNEAASRDIARYKKLIINWFTGIILVFILHYLIIACIEVSNLLITLLINIFGKESSVEDALINKVYTNVFNSKKIGEVLGYTVVYIMLVYYQFKFVIVYFMRMVKVYFFTIISPLVCMTYSLDKIKDEKSQAFDNWTTEMLTQIFKQPIQLLIYLIVIVTAGEIIQAVPLFGVICLGLLSNVEKIVTKVFSVKKPEFNKGLKDISLNVKNLLPSK